MTERTSLRPLRPYQGAAYAAAQKAYREGARAILLVAPTGAGKSRLGCEFVINATEKARGLGSVLWLAHREELVRQAVHTIHGEGLLDVGIIAPWARRQHAAVQVASIQTLVAQLRKGRQLPRARVVIFDEAHHASAEEWQGVAADVTDEKGNAPLLVGLTATPERGDGKPLGKSAGGLFDTLIPVSSVRELQALGVLVPCVTYAPETWGKALCREPVDAYRERGWGERCFVFCVSVAHAEQQAQSFRDAGAPAATIHANTPWDVRRARLEAFRLQDATPLRKIGSVEDAPLVLCNVYTLTEGVDVPAASVCITARDVGHPGMMQQMVGRVLRASEGKTRAIWWDLRGCSNRRDRAGNLVIGGPETDREYSLDGKAIAAAEDEENRPRKCKMCGASFITWAVDAKTGARSCPACGEPAPPLAPPVVREREVFAHGSGASDGERADLLKRWAETAVDKGYREGWVRMRFVEKFSTYPDRDAVDAAMASARELYGVRVTPDEMARERVRLERIATERGIPAQWVDATLQKKFRRTG